MHKARIVLYEVLATLLLIAVAIELENRGAGKLALLVLAIIWIAVTQGLDIFRRFPPNTPAKRNVEQHKSS